MSFKVDDRDDPARWAPHSVCEAILGLDSDTEVSP
jgi:hypothetical protein